MTEEKSSYLERRYGFWVEQLRHEAAVLWHINQVFLLPLVALMVFILSALPGEGEISHLGIKGINYWGVLFIALVGFLLSVVWLLSSRRSFELFDTRKDSVKKLEKGLNKELGELEKEQECLPDWGVYSRSLRGWWRIRHSVYVLVGTFVVVYGAILAWVIFALLYPCIRG